MQGHVLDVLGKMQNESVHCVVTSPPYWGLRDYKLPTQVWGGDDHEHEWGETIPGSNRGGSGPGGKNTTEMSYGRDSERGSFCLCGAWRGSLGLEPTPELFAQHLVEVFREVRRVLRDDGVLWLNLGDSYCSTGPGTMGDAIHRRGLFAGVSERRAEASRKYRPKTPPGLKPKDLIGIPWLVAKALQAPYYTGSIKREPDRAWLAAIIDGEGTICASRTTRKDDGRVRTNTAVFVTNTCRAMLDRCGEIWPAPEYAHLKPSDGHMGERDCYRWTVQGSEQKSAILQELYPYFISKKRQALMAWNLSEFIRDGRKLGKSLIAQEVRDKRDELHRRISALNQGQETDVPSWCKEPRSMYEPGWWLRMDVIWAKPNPMPESVTDRPTKAHEYMFLLTKSKKYFYDNDAVKEPTVIKNRTRGPASHPCPDTGGNTGLSQRPVHPTRNLRSVWTITTVPFPKAHFATFPPKLIEPCVRAGTSHGVCSECGAPWTRQTRKTKRPDRPNRVQSRTGDADRHGADGRDGSRHTIEANTVGWLPPCTHKAKPTYATVLDPFCGAGTVGLVCNQEKRNFIGIELNPEYCKMAAERIGHGILIV